MIPAFVATSHRRRSLVHRSRRARDRIPTIFFDGRPLSSSSRQARGTRATSRRAARRRPSSPPSRLRSALRRASARSRTPTPRRATRRSVVGQCIDLDLALVPPFVNPPQCVRVCVCVLDVRARSRARFAVREFAASCVSRLVNAPQCVCVCVLCVCLKSHPPPRGFFSRSFARGGFSVSQPALAEPRARDARLGDASNSRAERLTTPAVFASERRPPPANLLVRSINRSINRSKVCAFPFDWDAVLAGPTNATSGLFGDMNHAFFVPTSHYVEARACSILTAAARACGRHHRARGAASRARGGGAAS